MEPLRQAPDPYALLLICCPKLKSVNTFRMSSKSPWRFFLPLARETASDIETAVICAAELRAPRLFYIFQAVRKLNYICQTFKKLIFCVRKISVFESRLRGRWSGAAVGEVQLPLIIILIKRKKMRACRERSFDRPKLPKSPRPLRQFSDSLRFLKNNKTIN